MSFTLILFIYYISYPLIIVYFFLLFKIYENREILNESFKIKIIIFFLFFIFTLFIYSRFIERNLIFQKSTNIKIGFQTKIVLISDLHLGLFKGPNFLKRVVKKINKIKNVDAVLIAGDFIYFPSEDLNKLFEPLKDIKMPVYAVLGNHDSQKPGPPIAEELIRVLELNDVKVLFNETDVIPNTDIKIFGLGSYFANQDDISKLLNFSREDNLIVMAHNPDSAMKYRNLNADLTISGHTHGGQIRIPFIYKHTIPSNYFFNKGFYKLDSGNKVFVSSGIGEVGLPMRLGVPTIIDILELN